MGFREKYMSPDQIETRLQKNMDQEDIIVGNKLTICLSRDCSVICLRGVISDFPKLNLGLEKYLVISPKTGALCYYHFDKQVSDIRILVPKDSDYPNMNIPVQLDMTR
jgi:hypothetical protein